MRDVIPFSIALGAIVDELERLARKYRDSIAVRRAEVGKEVLRVYGTFKGMNRDTDVELVAPRFQQMKVAFGTRIRGRKPNKVKAALAAAAAAAAAAPK
jgi:hypothetical protein